MPDIALRKKLIRLAYQNEELRPHILPLLQRTAASKTARVDMKMADDLIGKVGGELDKALRACQEARRNLATWEKVAPLLEDWVRGSDIGSRYEKPHFYWLLLETILDEKLIPKLKDAVNKTWGDMYSSWLDGKDHMDPNTGLAYLEKYRQKWRR